MIIKNSQKDITIDLLPHIKDIALKISSSKVPSYILAMFFACNFGDTFNVSQ